MKAKNIIVTPVPPRYPVKDIGYLEVDTENKTLSIHDENGNKNTVSSKLQSITINGETPAIVNKTQTFSIKNTPYYYMKKLFDYLYQVQFPSKLDYQKAIEYYKTPVTDVSQCISPGGCTGVYKNKKAIRTLDWGYDYQVEFLVKVEADQEEGIHKSLAFAACMPYMTKQFLQSRNYDWRYELIPFATGDGINDAGVYIQQNVVPKKANDIKVIHTCVESQYLGQIIVNMLPRLILDKCGSASKDELNTLLRRYDIIRSARMTPQDDCHYLIADKNGNHCVLEFTEDGLDFELITNSTDVTIMTNFTCNTGITKETLALDWDAINQVNPAGMGLQRWQLIVNQLNNNSDFNTIREKLLYTNAYTLTTNQWLTEFTGQEYESGKKLTVKLAKDSPQLFNSTLENQKNEYLNRSRATNKTWQTIHAAIYDLENLTINVFIQERKNKINTYKLFENQ